ncbi:MAG: glucans biosynthesis glucosyltransferase MdoH [Acidobacteriota bacterium]
MDFFVLSDTTDPEKWLAEEAAWAETKSSLSGAEGFYYRHRAENVEKKSGNIRDFCERWGAGYQYMIILDADSTMAGWTILEMIRRMEACPNVAILQVPPVCVNRHTVFARMQQFVAGVYGRTFVSGYALWAQTESTYWGHNAILRLPEFIRYCGLPRLPGPKPFGGEILSHDFVEAAYMTKAGLEVRVAADLGGSYEECPTTISEFAKRSRRWCQGNLQHLRLILLDGFHLVSRAHFGMGAMACLSSVLWLCFMVLAVFGGLRGSTRYAPMLLSLIIGMLFLPKLWSYLALLPDRNRLRAHGGAASAAKSVLIEAALSFMLAPILMLYNTAFVVAILSGKTIDWGSQRRDDAATSWAEAIRTYGPHTAIGLVVAFLAIWLIPAAFVWLVPFLLGPVLAIPLGVWLSDPAAGQRLRERGIFLIPEETNPDWRKRGCLKSTVP